MSCSVAFMACKATRMISVWLPKHPRVFSHSGKLGEEIGFPSAEFSLQLLGRHRQSGRPSRDHIPLPQPLAPLFCPMHRKRCLSRDLPHPLLGAMSPRHAKQEEVKRPRLQTAIASRAKLLFYKASISCSSTLTALERMHGVG